MTIVLSTDDTTIFASHLEALKPGGWLPDSIIDYGIMEAYHKLTPENQKLFCPLFATTSIFITCLSSEEELKGTLEEFQLLTRDVVAIPTVQGYDPLRVSGTHWSLLLFLRKASIFHDLIFKNPKVVPPPNLKPEDQVYLHFDSSQQSNLSTATNWGAKFSEILLSKGHTAPILPIPSPQQTNSFDCGIFLILFTSLYYFDIAVSYFYFLIGFSVCIPHLLLLLTRIPF